MIDERLKSLTKYVNRNNKIIDIGCDHALLDIYLVKNNIVNKVIVSDVSKNALMQGINNINKYNLSDKIYARCGNGLEVLNSNDDIDTVVKEALEYQGPVLVDCRISPDSNVLPMIPPGGAHTDIIEKFK